MSVLAGTMSTAGDTTAATPHTFQRAGTTVALLAVLTAASDKTFVRAAPAPSSATRAKRKDLRNHRNGRNTGDGGGGPSRKKRPDRSDQEEGETEEAGDEEGEEVGEDETADVAVTNQINEGGAEADTATVEGERIVEKEGGGEGEGEGPAAQTATPKIVPRSGNSSTVREESQRRHVIHHPGGTHGVAGAGGSGGSAGAAAAGAISEFRATEEVGEQGAEQRVDTEEENCRVTGPCLRCEKDELDLEYCKETQRRQEVRCAVKLETGVDVLPSTVQYRPCIHAEEDDFQGLFHFWLAMVVLGTLACFGMRRRQQKGETAFTHDPSYKPPHAVVDKWYRTEAGPKNSLAGRVEESRWQSCHSMQTGREPRKPTRSRLPPDQKKAGPGPTSYHMRDPWEVREVCGTVPKSRMFCEPVRRPRPQTTAFTLPPAGNRDMSVVTSSASTSACDESSPSGVGETRVRPVTSSPEPSASGATAGETAHHPPPPCKKRNPRKQRSAGLGECTGRRPRAEATLCAGGRNRPSEHRHPPPVCTTRAGGRARPPTVGPSSFARAERSTITDDNRRKEESYGKKAVRLLTRAGDIVVTVTRRRESAWGSQGPPPVLGPGCDGAAAAEAAAPTKRGAAAEPRSAAQEREQPGHDEPRRPIGRHHSSPGRRNRADGGGEGVGAASGANSTRARPAGYASARRGSTLEAKASRLLPDDLAASLTSYREPGRAELPLVFRATSAPIVIAAPHARVTKVTNRRRAARAGSRAIATSLGRGGGGGGGVTVAAVDGAGEWRREKEEEAHVERIVRAAEDVVAKSGGGSGSGDGGGKGRHKTSITTRLPVTLDPDFVSELPGGVGGDDGMAPA
eukprot:g11271.t1